MQRPREAANRPFILDFISSAALAAVAIIGAKGLNRAVGAIPALFYLAVTGGLAYFYFRAGWNSLRRGREGKR